MRVHHRAWECFKPVWWAAVGVGVLLVVCSAAVQWVVELRHRAAESAWDRVTASYEAYVLGGVVLTVLLLLALYVYARHELFEARGRHIEALEAAKPADTPDPQVVKYEQHTHISFNSDVSAEDQIAMTRVLLSGEITAEQAAQGPQREQIPPLVDPRSPVDPPPSAPPPADTGPASGQSR